ncbi:MAG: hypothetical protein ACHREM_02205 [Polyangiales bacterium]
MNNYIIIGITIATAVFCLFVWRQHKAGPPLPLKRRRIAGFDLTPVREKAMKRHGWTEARASELEAEYRDFLILIAENTDSTISPWTNDLDLFWHEHILDTKRYARDCASIFGHLIQHDPHIEKDPYRHQTTKDSTISLRAEQLKARAERRRTAPKTQGSSSSSDGFDVATWGCSASSNHSHGHHSNGASHDSVGGNHGGHSCGGGHSDGGAGHSCGGHSCGGHSCGGHGCGGGH